MLTQLFLMLRQLLFVFELREHVTNDKCGPVELYVLLMWQVVFDANAAWGLGTREHHHDVHIVHTYVHDAASFNSTASQHQPHGSTHMACDSTTNTRAAQLQFAAQSHKLPKPNASNCRPHALSIPQHVPFAVLRSTAAACRTAAAAAAITRVGMRCSCNHHQRYQMLFPWV